MSVNAANKSYCNHKIYDCTIVVILFPNILLHLDIPERPKHGV
jgi:hypothetical protein